MVFILLTILKCVYKIQNMIIKLVILLNHLPPEVQESSTTNPCYQYAPLLLPFFITSQTNFVNIFRHPLICVISISSLIEEGTIAS